VIAGTGKMKSCIDSEGGGKKTEKPHEDLTHDEMATSEAYKER